MRLFSRMLVIGAAFAGTAGTVDIATVSAARAADDLPVVDEIGPPGPPPRYETVPEAPSYDRPAYGPPPVQRPYIPGRYAPGPYATIPSGRYDRAPDMRPVLPPAQVMGILRSTGYAPLGQMMQRGWIYTVAVIDRNGDDGRLIIDARTGRIMRFVPAMEVDGRFYDRMAMMYGPPGPPPPTVTGYETRRGSLLDMQHLPRPPASVPRAAQRPAPKTASRTAPAASAPPPAQPPAGAAAAQPAPAERTADTKSAAETVGTARPSAPQPSTFKLWPTQAMPDVQPLE